MDVSHLLRSVLIGQMIIWLETKTELESKSEWQSFCHCHCKVL